MVLGAFVVSFASALTTCTLTAKPFMVGCAAMATMNSGATCKLACLKNYAPTITSITCTGTTLSTSSYSCTPINKPLYPWRTTQCNAATAAYGTFSGTGASSVTPFTTATLTTTGVSDRGQYSIGVLRTLGQKTAIEIQWSFQAPSGGGGDGFWAYISTAPSNAATQTKPTIDTTAVLAVEVDLNNDASVSDPNANHVAVLFGTSESHAVNTFLSNLIYSPTPTLATGAYIAMNTLVQPVSNSGAVTITTWMAGTIVTRDVITSGNTPAGVNALVTARTLVYLNVLSYQRSGVSSPGTKMVTAVKLCGAERPQVWSRFLVISRVRKCAEITSFGNPEITKPGIWKPMSCPATVPKLPPPPPMNVPSN